MKRVYIYRAFCDAMSGKDYFLLGFVIILVLTLAVNYKHSHLVSTPTNSTINNTTINNTTIQSNHSFPIYPDPTLTPGDVLSTNVTEICVSGYSATVRDVSQAEKNQVVQNYLQKGYLINTSAPKEYDHFLPLSIGGSNDIKNLWPEMQEPRPGFKEKDRVESYLHTQVCSGKMNLTDAQNMIRTDWVKVYNQII